MPVSLGSPPLDRHQHELPGRLIPQLSPWHRGGPGQPRLHWLWAARCTKAGGGGGRQVPRSTWRWPGLLGPCDDGVQMQPRWPGAQACRVPVWGKHLLPRAPPGPQLERTATLLYTPQVLMRAPLVLFFPACRLGSVGHGLPLPLTHLRFLLLHGGVPGPATLLSHIPWALLWCGFTSEGQKHRLYFGEIASAPGPKGKKNTFFI